MNNSKAVRWALVVALLLYTLEGWILHEGLLAILVAAVMLVRGTGWLIYLRLRRREGSLKVVTVMAIYAVCCGATVGTFMLNEKVARSRSDEVVAAVRDYKARAGHYPGDLNELVPRYFNSVPKPRLGFGWNVFYYRRLPADAERRESALLSYAGFPFRRVVYRFETGEWQSLD